MMLERYKLRSGEEIRNTETRKQERIPVSRVSLGIVLYFDHANVVSPGGAK